MITARTPRDFDIFCGMVEVTVTSEDVSGVGLALQPGLRVIGRVVLDREPGAAGGLDSTWTQVTVRRERAVVQLRLQRDDDGHHEQRPVARPSGWHVRGDRPSAGRLPDRGVDDGAGVMAAAVRDDRRAGRARRFFDRREPRDRRGADDVESAHRVRREVPRPAGSVAADYFLVVFPGDRALWSAGSRRVQFTRPSTNGDFVLRDLPAGQYRVAAMTDVDPDQLTNPAFLEQALASSIPFGLIDGQTVRQDLKVGR